MNNTIVILLMPYFILPINLSRAKSLSCYVDQMKFTFRNYIIMRYACNVDAKVRVTFGNFPLKFQKSIIILFGRCIWNVITRTPDNIERYLSYSSPTCKSYYRPTNKVLSRVYKCVYKRVYKCMH